MTTLFISTASSLTRVPAAKAWPKVFMKPCLTQQRQTGQELIGCEINREPPNLGSEAFHQKMGFDKIAEASLPNGKTVGYWIKKLS